MWFVLSWSLHKSVEIKLFYSLSASFLSAQKPRFVTLPNWNQSSQPTFIGENSLTEMIVFGQHKQRSTVNNWCEQRLGIQRRVQGLVRSDPSPGGGGWCSASKLLDCGVKFDQNFRAAEGGGSGGRGSALSLPYRTWRNVDSLKSFDREVECEEARLDKLVIVCGNCKYTNTATNCSKSPPQRHEVNHKSVK